MKWLSQPYGIKRESESKSYDMAAPMISRCKFTAIVPAV